MRRLLFSALVVGGVLASQPALAQMGCGMLTITGHPEYAPIAYRQDDRIVGAAPALIEEIVRNLELRLPVRSVYSGSWEEAQAAARVGTVDIIFGIYFNNERATYLDYVQPAFMLDPVVVMVPTGREFLYGGPADLIGRIGVTNAGESYGVEFDAYIEASLNVRRSAGVDAGFAQLFAGVADYQIIGLYPGFAQAARAGVRDHLTALSPAILEAEMFIAFSKLSACGFHAAAIGPEIQRLRDNGRIDALLADAFAAWNALYAPAAASVGPGD